MKIRWFIIAGVTTGCLSAAQGFAGGSGVQLAGGECRSYSCDHTQVGSRAEPVTASVTQAGAKLRLTGPESGRGTSEFVWGIPFFD